MKDLLKLPSNVLQKTHSKIACALIVTTLLSACADGGVQSGASAGDTAENENIQAAIALLQPYVGVYLLQDSWMGNMGDRAYLSIRLTTNEGTSEAALIDYDDTDNCVPERFSIGEVRKDPFSDRVFMDDILQFSQAELSLSADSLFIEAIDFFDTDNDSNTTEIVTIGATRLGLTEVDLGAPC
jgi:hypothetical protein